MYKIIGQDNEIYSYYNYLSESEFESMVIKHADAIFGDKGIYFDIKKRIGKAKKGASVPDGYFLNLMFHDNPQLYIVEMELSSHDIYGHIGSQVLRFAHSSETDRHKIKTIIQNELQSDLIKSEKITEYLAHTKFQNSTELLDEVLFNQKPSVIIVIDEETPELDIALSDIRIQTDVIEVQTFVHKNKKIHKFSSFQDDITDNLPDNTDFDELDTIVVPAKKDGFEDVFLGKECWYEIRLSASMIDKIKYIAAYQVKPISAITHLAEVDRIQKTGGNNKYIVYFKQGTLSRIPSIELDKGKKGQAPQSPRYTSYHKLKAAHVLSELWE